MYVSSLELHVLLFFAGIGAFMAADAIVQIFMRR